jgi:hypothetical protein
MSTKKIWTRVAIAVVVIVILIFMYRKFTKKSDYVIPPTTTSDTNSTRQTSYSSNLVTCETTYINAMNEPDPDATAANATLNDCITSNVVSYYNARCPFLPATNGLSGAFGNLTSGSTGAGIPNGGSSNVAYIAYKADIDAINAVYTPLISAAGQTFSTNIMAAARKADFTGASRKYIATLCPDIYSNTTSTALTTKYLGWTRTATAQSAYGFQASRVTTSSIWQWSIHAGQPPTASGTTYTPPTAALLTAPLIAASCTNSDFALSTNGVLNWQLAADSGPGTVDSSVTFPWTTSSTTICPASATLIPTATAANPLP